jgi:hypothetical protein
MTGLVLDAHVHCGLTLPYENIAQQWRSAGINGGVLFSPVEEIYSRYDPRFMDSAEYARSRDQVHHYLADLAADPGLIPYYFVWNDFSPIPDGFRGIKWHRHPDEPVYHYGAPGCARIIDDICRRRLPVVLEEEFRNTFAFIRRIEGRTVVIIPHLGALNGGYYQLKNAGVFEADNIWADTALAGRAEIEDFARTYGTDRLLFGSDYPFGIPAHEKRKVVGAFDGPELDAVLGGNLVRLLALEHLKGQAETV